MSWLFPDSALEEDIVECAEYSMAMEGAFTDAFKRNFTARKEMKPHKRAMNEAILAGDYKTAAKEAEECARILREAADEIKGAKPSLLSSVLIDICVFVAVEAAQAAIFMSLEKTNQKDIHAKYAQLDADVASGKYDRKENTISVAAKHQKEYDETAKFMVELNAKVQKLVAEGKPVPEYYKNIEPNRIFMSKVVGAERDGALKKSQRATKAAIGANAAATSLAMLVGQAVSVFKAKRGEISPAETNAILSSCIRSLNQSAASYERKAREYKYIGNGFESDMVAQEGFFSNIKANMQAKATANKARHTRDNELNSYFMEMESKLDNLYGDSGTETMLKYYVEYCSDKLVKGASSAMAKLLKAFDSFDLNQKDPWIYSNSGYVFLVSEPNDGDDSPLVWLPTKANVDKVARGDLEGAEYVELWGSDVGCPYIDICDAYALKKYAEAHPNSATESWLFSEPAQEGWFGNKVADGIARAQMKSSEQLRQQKSSDKKKRIEAAKKALELKSPKDIVAQFIQSGLAEKAVQHDMDYGNGGWHRPNLMAKGSKAKSICSSKTDDDENFEYCWDALNVSKYETFTVGDVSVVIAYAGNEPAGIGIPLTDMVLRTSEGYVEGTKAEVMKDPDLKENYDDGEYMKSYFTPVIWNHLLLKVTESITPASESEVVSSMGELEKAQAFVSAWLECHADDMEPLYGPEADILLKEFRAKHVAEELKEDPDYVDPHEERHCGRLTYLVEVKPDTTNITIPVCWNNRNTTVEYGSKEIEESLTRYYDMAVQPQNDEVIAEPVQEGFFTPKRETESKLISDYRQARQKNSKILEEMEKKYNDRDSLFGDAIWSALKEQGLKPADKQYGYMWAQANMVNVLGMNRGGGCSAYAMGNDRFFFVGLYTSKDDMPIKAYVCLADKKNYKEFNYIDVVCRFHAAQRNGSAATEGFAINMARKGLNATQKLLPQRVKDAQSAQRKDLNAQIKQNLQHASDPRRFFKIAAQAMYPQKGWLFSTEGKVKCDEIATRQMKNTGHVISAEVENIGTLYYVLVHTKETGYDEWVMYMPQVEGVKTRNLHQAAREIALAQAQNMPGLPALESNISFG